MKKTHPFLWLILNVGKLPHALILTLAMLCVASPASSQTKAPKVPINENEKLALLPLQVPDVNKSAIETGSLFKHCPECPEMVAIPGGRFDMGSNDGESDEKPLHRITLQPFSMGKTEVTQGLWKAIMGSNPSSFSSCGDNCPVEQVSWDDIRIFLQKLNAKTGNQYRLPTEAEWEYACRAGGTSEYCGSDNVDSVAWYASNSGRTTHPAATKQANAFGLYDMSGNVREWVQDSYHDSYNAAPADGSEWQGDGAKRVIRGGSWNYTLQFTRAAYRGRIEPSYRFSGIGFRLAGMLPQRQPGSVFKDCAECPEMVVIPARNFDMGSSKGESNEKPVHRVDLAPFAMGKTEVTQGQWKIIMGNNPSGFKNCGDDCPVEMVSWQDAQEFIKKLNIKTGKQYRLPSEAEWEYACRSGDLSNRHSRAGMMRYEYCGDWELDSVAWYGSNSSGTTHPAAQKEANPFGLYDMNGNVNEWVDDRYHNNYIGAPTDGSAWRGDDSGLMRGGSWLNKPQDVRATKRFSINRTFQTSAIGFRLARGL